MPTEKNWLNRLFKNWLDLPALIGAALLTELLLVEANLHPAGIAYYLIWIGCFYTLTTLLREVLAILWILVAPKKRD
jgi:hypothetical protein